MGGSKCWCGCWLHAAETEAVKQLDQMPEEEGLLLEFQMNERPLLHLACAVRCSASRTTVRPDHALDGHYSSQAVVIPVDRPSVELSSVHGGGACGSGLETVYMVTYSKYRVLLSLQPCWRCRANIPAPSMDSVGARRLSPTAPAVRSLS